MTAPLNELMSRIVETEIVEFTTDTPRAGRRGTPAIPAGTKLYAIKYSKGGYFTYSYTTRNAAEVSIENSRIHRTDNEFYYHWNVVDDVQKTMHHGKLDV